MYLRQTIRGGKIGLTEIGRNDVKPGDYEITPGCGSSSLELTVYVMRDRAWQSLGAGWQGLHSPLATVRRRLLTRIREGR